MTLVRPEIHPLVVNGDPVTAWASTARGARAAAEVEICRRPRRRRAGARRGGDPPGGCSQATAPDEGMSSTRPSLRPQRYAVDPGREAHANRVPPHDLAVLRANRDDLGVGDGDHHRRATRAPPFDRGTVQAFWRLCREASTASPAGQTQAAPTATGRRCPGGATIRGRPDGRAVTCPDFSAMKDPRRDGRGRTARSRSTRRR
jgi:hypothetical protein